MGDIDMSGYQPVVRQSFKKPRFCEPGRNFCKPNSTKQTERTIYLNLPEYQSENIQVEINKEGRVLVNASKNKTVDTDRNGQRKTTVHMEHSFDLPEYLVKEDMQVEYQWWNNKSNEFKRTESDQTDSD